MLIELTEKEYRRLLDMVYIGNWILNSTRGSDRFHDYDRVESKIFSYCKDHEMQALVERWNGETVPSGPFPKVVFMKLSWITRMPYFLTFWQRSWPVGIWITPPSPPRIMMNW